MISRAPRLGAALAGGLALLLSQPGCTTSLTGPAIASIEVFGNAEVTVGSSITLHTIRKDASGSTIDSPGNITWSTSDAAKATVGAQSGVVTGVQPGTVRITATSGNVGGFKDIEVKSSVVPVNTVTVSGPTAVQRFKQITLTATLRDASGNQVFRNVFWTSSDPLKATVGANDGIVVGVAEGTVTITALSEGKTGTAQVTVQPPAVENISLTGSPVSVNVGQSLPMTIRLSDINNNTLTGRTVTWSSSDETKATVANGVVTGVAAGSTTITATSEGKNGTWILGVNDVTVNVRLSGRVVDGTNSSGLSNATVTVLRLDGVFLATAATTPSDGSFTTGFFGAPASGIIVEAVRTGYVTGRIQITSQLFGDPVSTEPIPLVPTSAAKGAISGVVRHARTGQPIAGASLALYNHVTSAPVAPATANGSGVYTFSDLAAGTYRVAATAPGFQLTERIGIAVGNNGVTGNQDLVLAPNGSTDIRIVLTWGAEPQDLDSHLTGPDGANRFHVYFAGSGNFNAPPFAGLDTDDTFSYGPETISITQMSAGNYRYSVHDFTNRNNPSNTLLGNSGAVVRVYTSNGLFRQFSVPQGTGNLWTVFEMTGTLTNPVIVFRNEMSFTNNANTIPSPPALTGGPAVERSGATDADLIGRAVWRAGGRKAPRGRIY